MNNKFQIIEWGKEKLISKRYLIEQSPEIIVETPWSTVVRLLTSTGYFYLKQTPADLFIEPDIMKVIRNHIKDSPTPNIYFKNPELNCYLMDSCGDHSLRTKFQGVIDSELLIKGLSSYINILRSFENDFDALEAIGVPDWRINHIPRLYVELLEKKEMLLSEGLTLDELDKLRDLVPTVKSICEFIMNQKVKDTLNNCDFNENNMIINEASKKISFIDWGESVISHPFFSIASHLQSNARRYQLELNGTILDSIRQKCLACWLDVANQPELDEIYENILRLLPILSALGIYRLQAATHNKSKKMQRWFIKGNLQVLLKNEKM